jgi:hypothetical protein
MDTRTGAVTTLLSGKGDYKQVAIDETGRQVAFLSNVADFEAKQPAWALYHWDGRSPAAREVANVATAGIPAGWWISDNGTVRFSQNGQPSCLARRGGRSRSRSSPPRMRTSVSWWTSGTGGSADPADAAAAARAGAPPHL